MLRRKKKQQEQMLQTELFNQSLRDEIAKEVKLSSVVQESYHEKLAVLQASALQMCKSIELEKRKNQDLKTIIRHMETKMQQNRQQDRTPAERQPDEESSQALTKILHKLQYDYDQLVQKHNEAFAQIKDTRDKVNACRAERVIYSGVFRNIQREIRLMEQEYLKLIIERDQAERQKERVEKEHQKKVQEFDRKVSASNKVSRSNSRIFPSEHTEKDRNNQTFDIKTHCDQKGRREGSIAPRKIKDDDGKVLQQHPQKFLNLASNHAAKIQHIRAETGIEGGAQQFSYYLTNIQKINTQLFSQSQKLTLQIFEKQQTILGILKQKNVTQSLCLSEDALKSNEKAEILKDYVESLQSLNQKIKVEREVILKSQNAKLSQLCGILDIPIDTSNPSEETIFNLFQQLQEAISPIIDYDHFLRDEIPDPKRQVSIQPQRRLTELIEGEDRHRQCEKLLGHHELEEICRGDLNRQKTMSNLKGQNQRRQKQSSI